MSSRQENCPLCERALDCEETVIVREKGADSINRASIERGVDITVEAGNYVHTKCRINHINKKDIALSKKRVDSGKSVKRSARVSLGAYNSKTHCFFCGTEINETEAKRSTERKKYSFVKTDAFVQTILLHCKTRGDEWALAVQGRIEYYDGDLHAADCVYHQSCNVNFRTMKDIPKQFLSEDIRKQRKIDRPKDNSQDEAFEKVCVFLEENDEEQLSVSDLVAKMNEYLTDTQSTSYGNQYLMEKLKKRYGDSIFVAQGIGVKNIVTFREKTSRILRDNYNAPRANDEEAQKRAILQTAAKLIKSDIKSTVPSQADTYPSPEQLKLVAALEYVPQSLRFLFQNLFVGKDTSTKVTSIGPAIIQAVRPRAVIAPLQLGLAVQMHYMYRSRFLIDSLSNNGFSSSYSEVQRFEENAACSLAPDELGGNLEGSLDSSLLFAGDNVDHNIIALDGKGTFHGMGMVAAITPGKQIIHNICRQKVSDLKLTEMTKIDITDYRLAKYVNRSIVFQSLILSFACDFKVDIFWEMSFYFHQSTPSWQGMMHILHNDCEHPGKSSVLFLPMIDMNPGDKTCIFSTLQYLCKLATKYNMPAIITFDQPLYWKASDIVNHVQDDSPIRKVVLLLGSFHTFMNLLGAIGTLMDGSGLKEILGTVYGDNAVMHMMNGKSVQRAFRGHLLVDKSLTGQIVDRIITDDPSFTNQVEVLEQQYSQIETGAIGLPSLNLECISKINRIVNSKRKELAGVSKTSQLWINYQQMVRIARELVAADRMGSWDMHLSAVASCLPIFAAAGHTNYLKTAHLYLQKMQTLQGDHPEVYHKFQSGKHVIRRSNKYWAGLGSDLVIEQTLMRSLKSQGGLTRGSGMSEHQRAVWTMSSTVSSSYNFAMQELTTNIYTTSEQHKELTSSRKSREESDLAKIRAKFDVYTPFADEKELHNIITGVNANDDVNVHDLFTVGNDIVKQIEGHPVFSYVHKRSLKVKTMASNKAVKIAVDRTIDPALLFQRFLVVSQTGDLQLSEVMTYELCQYPMSLFEAKDILRRPDKPQLAEAIRNHAISNEDTAITQVPPVTDHYVLDGGSLLHRLKWTEGCSYGSIADQYGSFTLKHYVKATVVFDGYGPGGSIKDCTHQRWGNKLNAVKVNITGTTKFVGKKEDFLSNEENKRAIIQMIMANLQQRGCEVIQAEGDADVMIAKSAITMSTFKPTTLIGEDTDLLILLLHYLVETACTELYFRSDKTKSNVYNIKTIKQVLGEEFCKELLFLHAFTGCDSTSRVFGIGKKSAFQRLVKKERCINDCAAVFCSPHQSQDTIESSGCIAMGALFNGRKNETLASIRYNMLCRKVAKAKSFVTPERLPPTSSACKFHCLRTYYQVMEWMGLSDDMEPSEWGWKMDKGKLVPVMTDKSPAPEMLLEMIHCNCVGGCITMKCTCKKHGLDCTSSCGHCQEGNCENMNVSLVEAEEDDLELD